MQNFILKFKVTSLLLVFAVIFPIFSNAQELSSQNAQTQTTDQTAANIVNEFSAPSVELNTSSSGRIGQTAKISAILNNISPDVVEFIWYLDDTLSQNQSGKGKTEFSFITSRENHVVRVAVMENNAKIAENAILVSSYNVSLVWKADTYVPPDYAGKALPSRGSRVTVTAIPDIKGYEAKDLLFTWYLDAESRVRSVLSEDSFSFVVSKSVDFITVFVEVSNLSRSFTVSQAVSIPVVRPSVLLYHTLSENTAEQSLKNLYISPGESASVTAKPFNFRIQNLTDINYLWSFAGQTGEGERTNPNLLTLKIPDTSALGAETLTLQASNINIYTERTTSNLFVNVVKK